MLLHEESSFQQILRLDKRLRSVRVAEIIGILKDLGRDTDVSQEGEEINCWSLLWVFLGKLFGWDLFGGPSHLNTGFCQFRWDTPH